MTKSEIAAVKRNKEDRKYWKELEKYLPWKLYSWSGRQGGSFSTNVCRELELTGEQRDQILFAITLGIMLRKEKP